VNDVQRSGGENGSGMMGYGINGVLQVDGGAGGFTVTTGGGVGVGNTQPVEGLSLRGVAKYSAKRLVSETMLSMLSR
jgi:hypothetical protein